MCLKRKAYTMVNRDNLSTDVPGTLGVDMTISNVFIGLKLQRGRLEHKNGGTKSCPLRRGYLVFLKSLSLLHLSCILYEPVYAVAQRFGAEWQS